MAPTDARVIADPSAVERPRLAAAELLAVAVAVLAAESALVLGVAEMLPLPGGGVAALAGHLAVSALVWLWVWSRVRRDLDVRLPGLLAVTTPVLGPLGAVATLMTTAMVAVFSRFATGFHEWYLSLFPESEVEPARELYELIVTGREQAHMAALESFTDVMTVGTPQQKQAVIALVARHFRPAFTPALKLGLADADPSVRVQAATATARVEHEFNERWLKLEAAVQAHPGDLATRAALARHLDEYAFCGLLDAAREQEVREKALEQYIRCLELVPEDGEIRLDLGRLQLRMDLVAEAADVLAPLVDDTADRRVLVWYAECLFRLGRYGGLRALCRRRADLLGPGAEMSDTLAGVIGLWRDEAAPLSEAA